MNKRFYLSLANIITLCVVIMGVSSYFIYHSQYIGFILLGLGVLCLISLVPFRVEFVDVWPDVVFGLIDNGILAVMAIFGGEIGGVIGAVIGGVVGNAVTDGIAGIFEGMIAEKNRRKSGDQRTMLGSAVGKMSGCLLSAGAVLLVVDVLGL